MVEASINSVYDRIVTARFTASATERLSLNYSSLRSPPHWSTQLKPHDPHRSQTHSI